MAEPTEADKEKAFGIIIRHCGQSMDAADYRALETDFAAALAEEREARKRAMEIVRDAAVDIEALIPAKEE